MCLHALLLCGQEISSIAAVRVAMQFTQWEARGTGLLLCASTACSHITGVGMSVGYLNEHPRKNWVGHLCLWMPLMPPH